MRRFRFRLERLLEVRRYVEKQWEAKLAEKTGHCVNLQNRIQDARRRREETFRARGDGIGGPAGAVPSSVHPLDLAWLLGVERFRARLDQEKARLESELAERQREREEILVEYREASRACKVLEKLKEKRADGHRERQRREESRVLDEIAGARSSREEEWLDGV